MGGLLAALASLAKPILARVLLALGFSVITVTGLTLTIGALRAQLMNAIGAVPTAGLEIAGLAGVWDALGMVLGAATFIVAWWGMTKAVRIGSA